MSPSPPTKEIFKNDLQIFVQLNITKKTNHYLTVFSSDQNKK